MIQIDKHKETFKEEAYELLGELENSLLELGNSPDDPELIGRVFRVMHTIKGSGAMFGFSDIAEFTHEIESVFDHIRNGEVSVTNELINLALSSRDHIRVMLDAYSGGDPADGAKTQRIIESFKKFAPVAGEKIAEGRKAAPAVVAEKDTVYRIRFRPVHTIFMNGTNPLRLLAELRAMGDCRIVPHLEHIPPLHEINPEHCYTYWDIILTTKQNMNAIQDVFIFVADDCELSIKVIDEGTEHKKLGEILIERGDITQDALQQTLGSQKRVGDLLVDTGLVTREQVQSALIEQEHIREIQAKQQKFESASSIRVSAAKLDNFVDRVGELVIIQQRLSQTAIGQCNSELFSIAEEVERLTVELRDSALSIRMLPIGTLFNKFKRLVHDLSGELGREVDMAVEGADTELDKTVIEQLNDPLVHLIRNSIDHGIEPPESRESKGKPRRGTVHLSAAHSGSNVLIKITDDGKGLDSAAIRSKAIEKGLISSDAVLSEKEIFDLIFVAGFSTASQVTSVSGRGVGMDVVRRTIDSLRGSIDISSKHGTGTIITIKLPLTLAIIEGLLVDVGGERFVMPLSLVEECIELTRDEAARSNGWYLTNVRSELVPYIRLREWFSTGGEQPAIEQIVIVRINGQRIGFVVDNVIGEHQTVIKSLGKVYRHAHGVSGASILGDGRVALILDISQLVQGVESFAEEALSRVNQGRSLVYA